MPGFNPYHKWLGIPKGLGHPTHWQILGISVEEDDADVISAAAVRQSAYVRNFQTGPYGAEATRILGEIEEAKLALLRATQGPPPYPPAGRQPAAIPQDRTSIQPAYAVAQKPIRRMTPGRKFGWIKVTVFSITAVLSSFVLYLARDYLTVSNVTKQGDRTAGAAQADERAPQRSLSKQETEPQSSPADAKAEITNSLGMKLILISAGEFQMGSVLSAEQVHQRFPGGNADWYQSEQPRHKVRITRPFYLGAHEVTVGQFHEFVMATSYTTTAERENSAGSIKPDGSWEYIEGLNWHHPGFAQDDGRPVTCVSWLDANEFCAWLSGKEKKRYRLPSEAEWEYACRAGTDTLFAWGDDPDQGSAYVNGADSGGAPHGHQWDFAFPFRDGFVTTATVGSFQPNGFGLYDMTGNVGEWCADWFAADYYALSPANDPPGPETGSSRVVRSSSWNDGPAFCRATYR